MELPVKNAQGQEVRRQEVSEALFGVPMNMGLVHQALVMHQANQRQGTAGTKTRGMVSGGGRKPWAQKHTGRARQGSTRAPQWRHGGTVFGPHPRSYRKRMPKKMRRLAIRCVLSDKVREERLILVEELALAQPKTREMAQVLQNLGVKSSALVVLGSPNTSVAWAVRNLERVKTLPPGLLNVLDLLRYDHLVITVEALHKAQQLWAPEEVAVAASSDNGAPQETSETIPGEA